MSDNKALPLNHAQTFPAPHITEVKYPHWKDAMNHEQWRTLGLLLGHYLGGAALISAAVLICRFLS